jgi:hypothetical protein
VAGGRLSLISGPGRKRFLFQGGPKGSTSRHSEGHNLNPMELDAEAPEPFSRPSPTRPIPDEKWRRTSEQRQQGRERLAKRWKEEVLPRILPHYFLFHVHRPYAGRSFDEPPLIRTQCTCAKTSVIRIIIVQLNSEFLAAVTTRLISFQHLKRLN